MVTQSALQTAIVWLAAQLVKAILVAGPPKHPFLGSIFLRQSLFFVLLSHPVRNVGLFTIYFHPFSLITVRDLCVEILGFFHFYFLLVLVCITSSLPSLWGVDSFTEHISTTLPLFLHPIHTYLHLVFPFPFERKKIYHLLLIIFYFALCILSFSYKRNKAISKFMCLI